MYKIFATKPLISTLVTLVTLLISIQMASAQEKSFLNRTILLENKVELPSNNVNAKIIRVTFPFAFKTPLHTHEGPGPRYVVKGKFKVIEGGKTNIYSVGDVFWESGDLMSVENVGEDTAELIIFELAPNK
ncbi:MAG: cupin domain-containing protein [Methylococcales bacterium]|nr:MAG: cupin domain-containing protein [Methylococcales bacterium]